MTTTVQAAARVSFVWVRVEMCCQLCKQMLFSASPPDGSAINENTQGLFPRSLQVSAFMKATFSQTQEKVHVLSCSVQNTLCVDSQGTVVWYVKIKESDVGKGFDCYAIRSDCGVTFPFCLLKSTLHLLFTLQPQTAKHSLFSNTLHIILSDCYFPVNY